MVAKTLKEIFGCTVVKYCKGRKKIKRMAFCSGGGGSLTRLAIAKGADAYICGDVKHDQWISAVNNGISLFDCGHYHTEVIMVNYLKNRLAEKIQGVEFVALNGRAFLERLGYREENGVYKILRPNEEKVALFCHAALTRAWLSSLFRIPINLMWSSFDVTHTGVTILEFRNNENGVTAPQCLCFSDVSHLYREGLDLLHNNRVEM